MGFLRRKSATGVAECEGARRFILNRAKNAWLDNGLTVIRRADAADTKLRLETGATGSLFSAHRGEGCRRRVAPGLTRPAARRCKMRQHAAAAPSNTWFHPTVRDVRHRAPRTVPPVAPAVRTVPAAPARVRTEPGLSWLERVERWLWRIEQKRVEDYLARSVDLADLEMRLRTSRATRPLGLLILDYCSRATVSRERELCRAGPRGPGARDTGTPPRVRRRGRRTRPSSSRPARVGLLFQTSQRRAIGSRRVSARTLSHAGSAA